MIAKKHPLPDGGHAEQTRKVDAMSELVAGLMLDDPDATSPPDPSSGSLSAVRQMAPRRSARPPAYAIDEEPRSPRVVRAILIALLIALGVVAVVAVVLFTR